MHIHNSMFEYIPFDDPDEDSYYNSDYYIWKEDIAFYSFKFEININRVYSKLMDYELDAEKINYLERLIDGYSIRENFQRYRALAIANNFTFPAWEDAQPFWVGMVMALEGKKANPFINPSEGFEGVETAFEAGFSLYKVFCTLNQWIFDLQNGKGIVLPNTSVIATKKTLELKSKLCFYDFMELETVACLAPEMQNILFLLLEQNIPYAVAMLDRLDFFKQRNKRQYFRSQKSMFEKLGEIFDVNERTISGNYQILNPRTLHKTKRYTANDYIKRADQDYNDLKIGRTPSFLP